MASKTIDNVKIGMTWTSYMGSVQGVLESSGMWKGETWKLMGMTGIAFHFIVHKQICPSSVTVYEWLQKHYTMMDRIGIFSEAYQNYNDPKFNTFEMSRAEGVKRIKESIDNDRPVVVWAPTEVLEFGIIKGYNDEDGIFQVVSCNDESPDPLLYSNLGKSEIPFLFYQIFKDKTGVDKEKIFRGSLEYGLEEWREPNSTGPDYASGRNAYEYLVNALKNKDYDLFGLSYILSVYNDSKNCILQYLGYVSNESAEIGNLDEAIALYSQISKKYNRMAELVPFKTPADESIDDEKIYEITSLAQECLSLEDKAMDVISKSL